MMRIRPTRIFLLLVLALGAPTFADNLFFHLLPQNCDSGGPPASVWIEPNYTMETEQNAPKILTVRLSAAICESVTIGYNISAPTATSGMHFSGLSAGAVTIPKGQTSGTISYSTLETVPVEAERMWTVALESSSSDQARLSERRIHSHLAIDDQADVPTFISGSGGEYFSCAIDSDNVLKCWGYNEYGHLGFGVLEDAPRPRVVDPGVSYAKVAAGTKNSSYHVCGITTAGVLKCWGENGNGQLGVGDTSPRRAPAIVDSGVTYATVSVSSYHSCGVTTTGVLKCWGYNSDGQIGNGGLGDQLSPVIVDSGVTYSQVAAGAFNTCGVTTMGAVKCWGTNWSGQIGDGTMNDSPLPIPIDGGVTYAKLAAGYGHVCGITTAGALRCWGANDWSGQLGDGTMDNRLTPVVIDSGTTYIDITAGDEHTCGVTSAGVLKCWGGNWGQLGDGTYNYENPNPKVIDEGVLYSKVWAGNDHTCGVPQQGGLKCWGWGAYDGSLWSLHETEKVVDPTTAFSRIAVGNSHSCGITTAGILKCWGYNENGEIGDGAVRTRLFPTVSDRNSFSEIAAGGGHTCGITTAGVLKCWGKNSNGQIGDGTTTTRLISTVIDSSQSYKAVTAGQSHTCGITMADQIKCWGMNTNGQLGDGTTTQKTSPTPIADAETYTVLSSGPGSLHTCGITTVGVLKCWGQNPWGQLGDGTTTQKTIPTIVDSGTGYVQVSAGKQHTCGITTAGDLKCWGLNQYGQLGDGTTTQHLSPTLIDSGQDYVAIAVKHNGTCGTTSSGDVKCWGRAEVTGEITSTPTLQPSAESYVVLSGGSGHICGVTASGALKCWGTNYEGEMGIGAGVLNPHFVFWHQPHLTFSPSPLTGLDVVAPATESGWQSVTVTNNGQVASSAPLAFSAQKDLLNILDLDEGTCAGNALGVGQNCSFQVRFENVSKGGLLMAQVRVQAGDQGFILPVSGMSTGYELCGSSPAIGEACGWEIRYGGTFNYGGALGIKPIWVMPGGCLDSPNPTCPDAFDSVEKRWGLTTINHGTTSTTAGLANTMTLATNWSDTEAARYCANLTLGIYDDWYLPATNELNQVYANRVAIGGFPNNEEYWASTQTLGTAARSINFSTGVLGNGFKSNKYKVRCIRRDSTILSTDPTSISELNVVSPATSSGWQPIIVTNVGFAQDTVVVSVTSEAEIGTDGCTGQTLEKDENCTVFVRLTPTSNGIKTATVTVTAGESTRTVSLFGTATGFADTCMGSPSIGNTCGGGAIYAGIFDGGKYMIMPSGCSGQTFHPTCSGGADSHTRTWNGSGGFSNDIAGITNIASAATPSSSAQRGHVLTPLITAHSSTAGDAAAEYCALMNFGGYDDWYLPSKSEMAYIYCKASVGSHNSSNPQENPNCTGYGGKTSELTGFSASNYLSATEVSSSNVWASSFSTGSQASVTKTSSARVRCIRRFGGLEAAPSEIADLNVVGPSTSSAWRTVTVTNTSGGSTGTLATSISGAHLEMSVVNTCEGVVLTHGETCSFQVRATGVPDDMSLSGSTQITDGTLSITINLSGTATGIP